MRFLRLPEGNTCTLENLQRSGCGEWEAAMRAINPAASFVQRRDMDFVHTQRFQAYTRADDVCDRIQRAHLVEMHIFYRHPMNLSLCLGNPLENAQGMLFDEGCQVAVLDQLTDLPVSAAMHLVVFVVVMPAALVAMIVIVLVAMAMMVMTMLVLMRVPLVMRMAMRVSVLFLVSVFRPGDFAAMVRVVRLGQPRG